MSTTRRTGAGYLAAAALVLGATALAFVAPPRHSGAPHHAQLRAVAEVPSAAEADAAADAASKCDWSAASILSVSAAFGLLLGVALGPQPAVAGLSDRMSAATGTVSVPKPAPPPPPPAPKVEEAKPAPPPPAPPAPKVEEAKPAPPPPAPAPKVEAAKPAPPPPAPAPKVEAPKPAPPPPPPPPPAPKVEAAKPAPPPPPPPAPKVEPAKPAPPPPPAPKVEAKKPAPAAAPKAQAKKDDKVFAFFGMNTPEYKRTLPQGVYRPVKGPGDLFGSCGKRCPPNPPLVINDCKDQLCGTRDETKPALRKIKPTGQQTLNDWQMTKGETNLGNAMMRTFTDIRKKAPARMVQTGLFNQKVRAEGLKRVYSAEELQGGTKQPKTPGFPAIPPPDDPRSVAMREKLIPELQRLKEKGARFQPGNPEFKIVK